MNGVRWILAVCVLVVLAACGESDTTTSPPEGPTPLPEDIDIESAPPVDHTGTPVDGREVSDNVGLDPTPAAETRNLRRMSIDQLRDAMAAATGGIYWTDEDGDDMLAELEPTLGVPDYIESTSEDLEPSLVFLKFLGDGARQVCDEAVRRDIDPETTERVITRFVDPHLTWEDATATGRADIERNLRYLSLRFTGHYIAPDDDGGLADLRWLFRTVSVTTGDATKAWRSVCVGLMTSPEFYLY